MCLGFGTSAWLSRLPDVRDDLGLTPATIGTMLLIASLGSLLTLPTSGPIVTTIGARASGRIGVLIWALGIVCAGLGALNASIPLTTAGLVLLAAAGRSARTSPSATRQAAYPACPCAFLRRLGRRILVGRNACDVALLVASVREEESWRE